LASHGKKDLGVGGTRATASPPKFVSAPAQPKQEREGGKKEKKKKKKKRRKERKEEAAWERGREL
jgi:hypothetical protein